ncbi:MAG: toll/interleukin-1 receptor domain-containing protein [Clostridia bacterium]|nr:toll/interleukin-1 receptor domain-containing protein [Clostridia bacterium]
MYNKLIREGLINSSVAEVLFGDEFNREIALMSDILPKTVHEVCLFYSTLVQAYVIGVAHKKGVTVTELEEYGHVSEMLTYLWSPEKKADIDKGETIFSFITDCSLVGGGELVSESATALIGELCDAYKKITARKRIVNSPVSGAKFIEFIKALPLLRQCEIDVKNNKLTIDNGKYRIECNCSPYFVFIEYNEETGGERIISEITENCYLFTSSERGERDGELLFNYSKLNSSNKEGLKKRICRKVSDNENLILICKAIGIETQWYEDSYWCDFAFIKKLADATNESLLTSLDLDSPQRATSDIRNTLNLLFKGTSLENVVPKDKSIYPSQLKMFIYELFITQGVFKSIYSLMHAGEGSATTVYTEKLFRVIMETFHKEENLAKEECERAIEDCKAKIEEHLEKLKKIVTRDTQAYRARASEIRAEQRTICILHTAGIKNDKIVADAEELLSIDDFYDMFVNPETSINEVLGNLLSLLCCFYGAILQNNKEFNSTKYYQDVYRLRKEYNAEKSVEYLFDAFSEIVEKSQGNEVIDKLIGRESICDVNKLIGFKDKILALKREDEEGFYASKSAISLSNGPGMFISYCRDDNTEDNPKISRVADYFKSKGINVFFDTSSIDSGDDWKKRVRSCIRDKNTVMVLMFVSKASILRPSVEFELAIANDEAKKRFDSDAEKREHFLLTVNLEEENIEKFIYDMWTDERYMEFEHRIDKFKEIISHKTFRRINELDKIWENFQRNASESAKVGQDFVSDGTVLTEGQNDQVYLQIANFLAFLKYGNNYEWQELDAIDEYFNKDKGDTSYCVFPMVASVRETRIKRDNITVIGHEIIRGKGRANRGANYILSSKKLSVEEYYCVPNYKTVGENCSWMVEPLLISHEKFVHKDEE